MLSQTCHERSNPLQFFGTCCTLFVYTSLKFSLTYSPIAENKLLQILNVFIFFRFLLLLQMLVSAGGTLSCCCQRSAFCRLWCNLSLHPDAYPRCSCGGLYTSTTPHTFARDSRPRVSRLSMPVVMEEVLNTARDSVLIAVRDTVGWSS